MVDLSALGATTGAVWTRGQALAILTERQVRTLLLTGVWQVVLPGVYADAGYVLDAHQRAWAAVLASGGADQPCPFGAPRPDGSRRRRLRAVAAGRTAARVWSFPLIDDDDPATGATEHSVDDVAVWYHAAGLRGPTAELRRHELRLGGDSIVRMPDGLYVMSALRTLVHCSQLLTHEAFVCALDDALHRVLVTPEQLAAAVEARTGEPGVTPLRRGVAAADGRAEAPSETLARLLLKPPLPGLAPQVELFDHRARLVARFDLGDAELKLAVEADGKAGHSGERMVAKDQRRDRRTGAFGWSTQRATWWDLRRGQRALVHRVCTEADRLRASQVRRVS